MIYVDESKDIWRIRLYFLEIINLNDDLEDHVGIFLFTDWFSSLDDDEVNLLCSFKKI